MSNHLDEMKFFLEVAKSYATNTLLESYVVPVTIEKPTEISEQVLEERFIQDLVDLKESWLSLNSTNDNQNYAMGYEQGLYKAVEMLENLLSSKYNRRI